MAERLVSGRTDMKNARSRWRRGRSALARESRFPAREFVETIPDKRDSAAPEKNIACSRWKNSRATRNRRASKAAAIHSPLAR